MSESLWRLGAVEFAALIRSKQISAREVAAVCSSASPR